MSSAEENKALIRRFIEAHDNGDLETLDEMLAPDFVDHSLLPGQEPGREGFMQSVAEDRAALSNVRTTIEYQATDGDEMVISRLTSRNTHIEGCISARRPPANSVPRQLSSSTAWWGARSPRSGASRVASHR